MRISCPYCGERAVDEFTYLGDASVTRPDPASEDAADSFYTYAYERRNVAGPTQELWYHQAGCHAWLVVTRDTRTHEISDVKSAQDVALTRVKSTAGAA
ncbi:sarcosine oxidase subunit delta [Hyphomicrobium sp.]|jgi:sarcosine oxidase subunit delta|uniref:sarcosine oxidase subunit delta n=1 Tax=Hyphomicrobium sp. TaxID=82 RepID=UPI002CCE26F8|nr:sarcosine oxidase subunit delta [Hyphomicrobium sp.]HVZ04363.1 sarcosine oxidase subunit delta [Hyphomicrobium sp.]